MAAMSGGVDSSVAAALLAAEQRDGGPEVVGVWMRLSPDEGEGHELRRSCCSPDAADDARRVAQLAGIPFFVLNLEREFGSKVIDAFVDGYLDGATPNPCQACNQHIKFDALLQRGLAATVPIAVATGHYARVATRCRRPAHLLRARDTQGPDLLPLDLTQAQLAATRFPLGELTKPEVRAIAPELGAAHCRRSRRARRSASSRSATTARSLAERRGYDGEPGPSSMPTATEVGTHTGYAHYTVGQRHGLGLALGEAVYVREVVPATNTVVIGRRTRSRAGRSRRRGATSSRGASRGPVRGAVRIRHRAEPVACEVTLVGDDRLAIETAEPVWAPAPGQAAVLYDGEECSAAPASPGRHDALDRSTSSGR